MRNKVMIHVGLVEGSVVGGRWRGTARVHHTAQYGTKIKTYTLFISGIFH